MSTAFTSYLVLALPLRPPLTCHSPLPLKTCSLIMIVTYIYMCVFELIHCCVHVFRGEHLGLDNLAERQTHERLFSILILNIKNQILTHEPFGGGTQIISKPQRYKIVGNLRSHLSSAPDNIPPCLSFFSTRVPGAPQ